MAVGKFVLHRFNGDEEYEIQTATILAVYDEDGFRLWFDVKTEGVCRKSLPDTLELRGSPSAKVAVACKRIAPHKLVGSKFLVPFGYDADIEEDVATIYYLEHEDLDDNEIQVLRQDGDLFHVRWTGTTMDVNYHDGSKPRTSVEIEAGFRFKDMAKWLCPEPK